MLRIERDSTGCQIKLSGRITSELLPEIQAAMNERCAGKRTMNLSEVTLVDLGGVQFLIHCISQGVELVECPAYICEWINRECAESERKLGN